MLKVGDKVKWESQAQGFRRTKEGEIVTVLQPGQRPDVRQHPDMFKTTSGGYTVQPGFGRKEISYVVRVGRKHYWPRSFQLQPLAKKKCPHCGGEL